MKAAKQLAKSWAAVAAVAVLAAAVGGCVDASGTGGAGGTRQVRTPVQVRLEQPVPDGYYTGERHDFAARPNPDARGRMFRVAYLKIVRADRKAGKSDRDVVWNTMSGNPLSYMMLREQMKDDTMYPVGDSLRESTVRAVRSAHQSREATLQALLAEHAWRGVPILTDARTLEVFENRNDMAALNARLAELYPAVFSADAGAFPLDVVLCAVTSERMEERPVRTLFEAWLLGVPEHAFRSGSGLEPTEAFLDPYEAIAAALFKLAEEQLWGLEPANPADHDWLK